MNTELRQRLNRIERDLDRIPSRLAAGSTVAPAVLPLCWTLGGNTLVASPAEYGVKRITGLGVAARWFHLPTEARATATLGSGTTAGRVTGLTLTFSGDEYGSGIAITLSAPPSGGTQATASVTRGSGGSILAINVTNCGSGYTSASVAITGTGSGATATATVRNGKVVAITVGNPGIGYTGTPTVAITGDGSSAAGVAVMPNNGALTVAVVNQGAGYVTAPTVTISGLDTVIDGLPTTPWTDGFGAVKVFKVGQSSTWEYGRVVNDDHSLMPWALSAQMPDSFLSWWQINVKTTATAADADGFMPCWVPMGGGV